MNARGSYGTEGTHAAVAFALIVMKILLVPAVVILGRSALTPATAQGATR